MANLDIFEFPPFIERMDRYRGNIIIRSVLQLMTLTFVRTAELMPHIVPLSKQALEILEKIQPIIGIPYVFYNYSTAKPISSNALLCAI